MLPDFTQEYVNGLTAFSVHYFRELFRKIEPGSVLVLDNFQDVGDEVDLLLHLFNEIPNDVQVYILSRNEPPVHLAQLLVSDKFTQIFLQDILFTREESDEIVRLSSDIKLTDTQITQLYTLTQGWAAALVLTLMQLKYEPDFLKHHQFDDHHALFNYLLNEILSKFNDATKMILLKTSFLTRISISVAKKLTGDSNTKQVLEELSFNQILTIEHDKIDGSFEFHPLFREFLAQRAKQSLPEQLVTQLQQKAGKLLIVEGDIQSGAQQYIQSEYWKGLTELIKQHANKEIQGGLFKTVEYWISKLPENMVNSCTWLVYWKACCLFQYNPIEARSFLIKSLELFYRDKDAKGVYLCWCNLIESHIQVWDTLAPLRGLIERYYMIRDEMAVPGVELKARVTVNITAAMTYTWIEHKDFSKWLRKTEYFYRIIPFKQIYGLIGAVLGFVYYMKGNNIKLKKINSSISTLLESNDVTPLVKLCIYYNMVLQSMLSGDASKIQQDVNSALSLSASTGVNSFDRMFELHKINYLLMINDIEPVLDEIGKLQNYGVSPDDGFYGFFVYVKGRALLERENYEEALVCFYQAKTITENCGFFYSGIEYLIGITHVFLGDIQKGQKIIIDIKQHSDSLGLSLYELAGASFLAYIAYLTGDKETTRGYVKFAFEFMKNNDIYSSPIGCRKVNAVLVVLALKYSIDKHQIQRFVWYNYLTPPDEQRVMKNWPWPVKIYSLGRFNIVLNDNSLDVGGRPFDLLKVLISFGGRNVSQDKIIDALWPDADGDQALSSFKTTLHRLRKLFGDLNVLMLKNQQLSLNEKLCWVDSWYLNRLLSHVNVELSDKEELIELVDDILETYKGHFLSNESVGWVVMQREVLRTKYFRCVSGLAKKLESSETGKALLCYQYLLEIDPFIEEAYQGMIRVYKRLGKEADAQLTYRRCKEIFSSIGVNPSEETLSLLN